MFKILRSELVRNAILGVLIVMALLLFWKLLEFVGVAGVILTVGRIVRKVGLPTVFGQMLAVIVAVVGVALLGWGVRLFVGVRRDRFPILARVLSTEEQLQSFLQEKDSTTRKRVVLVDWPNAEVRSIGIITSEGVDESTGRDIAMVYLPNTPNPTGGSLRLIDREKLTLTDLTVAQAVTLCFSRGASARDGVVFGVPALKADGVE